MFVGQCVCVCVCVCVDIFLKEVCVLRTYFCLSQCV